MQAKKRQEKTKPLPELVPSVTEILVANGRAFQPFIRTFSYTGENITKSNLGTLVGVFEIDDQSEDSAYIVNFLASVAKKEYWSNPRRGAIESFEAALHKINLALAELVKHGNVTWLGKLHGALGVLEKNNFHFSITGEAKILLSRNESLVDISEGLASEESHIHPIKTFVEVSSGRLSLDDQLLLTSPELLALFSLEELGKNANRMGHERFTQFLKTALVNELDMAGLMVIEIVEGVLSESRPETAPAVGEAATPIANVFSQSAFSPKKAREELSVHEVLVEEQRAREKEEYVDTKTGHIYVQGAEPGVPNQHPFWEQVNLGTQDALHHLRAFFATQGKTLRRGRKQALISLGVLSEETQALGRKGARAVRRWWRRYQSTRAQKNTPLPEAEPQTPPSLPIVSDIPVPKKEEASLPLVTPERIPETPASETITPPTVSPADHTEEIPPFLREKLASFYKREAPAPAPETIPSSEDPKNWKAWQTQTLALLRSAWGKVKLGIGNMMSKLPPKQTLPKFSLSPLTSRLRKYWNQFQTLPQRKRRITYSVLLVAIVVILLAWLFPQTKSNETSEGTPPKPETPLLGIFRTDNESQNLTVVQDNISALVTSVVLNDQVYSITEKGIIPVIDPQTFPLPTDSPIRFAAAMDDLRLIFVYTENGRLYAFSPISKTFVENTLALPEGVRVAGIGTYLTYLYVLDSNTDQIYRFPRATGGFGGSVNWLKESTPIEDAAFLAVNETLFIAPSSTSLSGFFQGRKNVTFEIPPELSVTALYTYPDLANVYALDGEHDRLLVWNQEGKLMKEYTHDRFSEGRSLSVNEKTNEALIGTTDTLLSFKLK